MNENKFLLVKGRAGLGNRMLSALTGILYAHISGRKLLIDWSDPTYSSDGFNVFHDFFECPLFRPTDEIPATDSVNPSIWRSHLNESSIAMQERYGDTAIPEESQRRFSIDIAKLDYREDVLVMWDYTERLDPLRNHFKGAYEEFSRMDKEEILRKLLREDLTLHPRIRRRVDQFKTKHFNKETVGVHVRYTDHRASLWATLKKLNTLLKCEPELQIFLATDNIRIKSIFEDIYQDLITAPHWYSPPGFRLHGNRNCSNLRESGVEALVDLYLLAECDYLIIDTSSTFSLLAKLLAQAPDSCVLDLKQGEKLSPNRRWLMWKIMLKLGLFSWGLSTLSKLIRIRKLFIRQLER